MDERLLVLDVDGTLVGPDQTVRSEVREAVAGAQQAGWRICLATGRSLAETLPVWGQLPFAAPYEPLVLIGGALVAEPDTGRTLYHRPIPRGPACRFADALCHEGYSAMAIVDAWRHGVDYYLAESGDARGIHQRWFSRTNAAVRRVRRLAEVDDMPEPLRISAIVSPEAAGGLAERLKARFDGELNVHAIFAPNYGETIVEAFHAGADKWTAVRYVAQAYRIGPSRIVAVGDDINDLPLLRAAGRAVAMPRASRPVRQHADAVAEGGLAEFLLQLAAETGKERQADGARQF